MPRLHFPGLLQWQGGGGRSEPAFRHADAPGADYDAFLFPFFMPAFLAAQDSPFFPAPHFLCGRINL
jgi:hypothetical protein